MLCLAFSQDSCCGIITNGVRIYQWKFEWSHLIGLCFLFKLNLGGQYSTVQILGEMFANSAVLSRWVNTACVGAYS